VRAADERVAEEGARSGAVGGRRRRHARADPGRRGASETSPSRSSTSSTASVSSSARRSRRTRTARAAHDGDADPAHARSDGVRRSLRLRDREATGVAQADRHELDRGGTRLGGIHAAGPSAARGPAGLRRLSARRGVGDVLRVQRRRKPSACAAPSCASSRSGACTGG
jgi:hypothetical protein